MSANTVADRVRRLQASGIVRGYRADLNLAVLGRGMELLSDVRLREGVDRKAFEAQLHEVPQVVGAMRLTGDYDYQLRVDRHKADLGVRELRSRLLLHEVPLGPDRVLEP